MNFNIHIIKCPSGVWGFVGSLPLSFALPWEAKFDSYVRSGMMSPKFPSFPTPAEAVAYAAERGVNISEENIHG